MIHKGDIEQFVRNIEFRWIVRDEIKVLQYRVQKGDGFRGWGLWQDVREENETSK